ncbi:hypothetical protein GCM10010172_58550 [Paractinoplanes ferrugineus]|uniref:Clumping factor A n=1 Tax=Paractinoplanes ferrugineus TaxID=113564 RepID=A0A919J5D5_9ACTN|nr:hypothetical protein Afe05nite_61580 [Actinoplanes ferrugineus]
MIVASLLLILVAVALLVLGLIGGSSTFLISSIVASLLAAVALVIGARQNATARRAAETTPQPAAPRQDEFAAPADSFPAGPATAEPPYAAGPAYAGDPAYAAEPPFAADPAYADDPAGPVFAAEPEFLAERRGRGPAAAQDRRETVQFDADDLDEAYDAGRRDAVAGMTAGPADARRDTDVDDLHTPADRAFGRTPGDPGPAGVSAEPGHGRAEQRAEPDYDLASGLIGSARSDNPGANAWRHAEPAATDLPGAGRPGERLADPGPAGTGPGNTGPGNTGPGNTGPGDSGPAGAGLGGAGLGGAGLGDDGLAEPAEDDPADEPLPQTVSPSDAVRVARMDAEVLVVDGRPRYHVPECQHLVGKLSEPIPINEAVELGFSPCGLCRPVDRLVAAAARP